MKEIFQLMLYRLHTRDSNKLLVIGCFGNNEASGHEILFLMDGQILEHTMNEVSLKPVQFGKIGETLITKRYYLWVELPKDWEDCRQIKILHRYGEEEEEVKTIHIVELVKKSLEVPMYLDVIRVEKSGFYIEGWYIGAEGTELSIQALNSTILPVKMTEVLRPDVLREYEEVKADEVHGFVAEYEGRIPSKVRVSFKEEKKKSEQIVKFHDGYIVETLKSSISMCRKVYAYWRQFGLEASIVRAKDKLSGRKFTEYEEWFRRIQPFKGELRKQRRQKFKFMPKISIVVPLYKTPEKYLDELIESVKNQTYKNWELCLSDGSGKNSPMTQILKKYEKKEKRIRVVYNERQLHISENTNEALKIVTGDYIAFADHDDLLAPDALYECVRVLNDKPETEFIYSDEDKINMDGTEHFMPHFKPDFNLEMLRSNNYICHLVVIKRTLFDKVGMLNPLCDGAQDFDFVLRCVEKTSHIVHIPRILYHWRAHKDSTAESMESKPYVTEAGIRAVKGHYERIGMKAQVLATKYTGIYESRFELEENPMVSVIIPNKDHVDDLDKCMRSLESKNEYTNIEYIIVENNSQEEKSFQYYEELKRRNDKVRVLYWKGKGFNYSAINNFGVEHAKGEYLLLLNNDTEIINSNCIKELLVYCTRSEVAAVGAKLYYDDGTIQHAGVIIGLGGVAGHAFVGAPNDTPGYFCRAIVPQYMSAVTAACMMVKRSVYEEIGGLDEGYAVAFNDVDFCMKIHKAGYKIVYNPRAELFHYESKSRGYDDTSEKHARFMREAQRFQERWGEELYYGDPYYNPNLSLDYNDFRINAHAGRGRK